MYEIRIDWDGGKCDRGLCRFGWGTEEATVCGHDNQSFGYGGTGKLSFHGDFRDYGQKFGKGYLFSSINTHTHTF